MDKATVKTNCSLGGDWNAQCYGAWMLDEGNGTDCVDCSGNGRDGSIIPAILDGTDNYTWTENGLLLNGDEITVGSKVDISLQGFTVDSEGFSLVVKAKSNSIIPTQYMRFIYIECGLDIYQICTYSANTNNTKHFFFAGTALERFPLSGNELDNDVFETWWFKVTNGNIDCYLWTGSEFVLQGSITVADNSCLGQLATLLNFGHSVTGNTGRSVEYSYIALFDPTFGFEEEETSTPGAYAGVPHWEMTRKQIENEPGKPNVTTGQILKPYMDALTPIPKVVAPRKTQHPNVFLRKLFK